jgi:transitional endoplasmic reticulum ATPase
MSRNESRLLSPGEIIKDTYVVDRFLGSGAFAEVYRVTHKYLGMQAMKVLKPHAVKDEGLKLFLSEATILTNITHPNVVRIFDANSFKSKQQELFFIAMEFVSGETLFQLIKRKIRISLPLALSIQREICAGLSVAHKQQPAIIHRDVKPQNILLSYDNNIAQAKVSDFGVAKAVNLRTRITDSAGTITYLPPEGFWNYHTQASDVFSAGIVFYQMVTGVSPWLYDFSNVLKDDQDAVETIVLKARKKDPPRPSSIVEQCDDQLDEILLKSLAQDPSKRFKDAMEFLSALIDYENRDKKQKVLKEETFTRRKKEKEDTGKGFSGVAGMNALKELLYNEIILPLQQKDLFDKYRITLPNGILFYGPPGCGKTFLAKKLSEEISYTFIDVKPSDLASIYVHGSQEKIGKLFQKAREKAPAIVFIDEIDAVIPKRTESVSHHYSSEVNEFLSQLSECGRDSVIILGTTNRIDQIDPAALRTGRFDKIIYIPPPDDEARIALFDMFIEGRPSSNDIKLEVLSRMTANYVASDIAAIVNQAARAALKQKSDIDQSILISVINSTKPSVSKELIAEYERYRNQERL